jgi:hypothetical protein
MADDRSLRGPQDRQRINLSEDYEMRAEEGSEDYRLWDGRVLEEARKRS